ncbi:MAG TPA: 5-formyltetrahydrofolate cyclo-ligase, partial [Chryseobacterium indologenes]|nr:5-formyltetrahydrofolate cyclo-ligase [Chryseobacterium indologenes]
MQKAELRKQYIQKRKALSSDEAFLLSERIFQHFVHYFDPKETEKVHIFLPIL